MPCSSQSVEFCLLDVGSQVLALRKRYYFVFCGVNHQRGDSDFVKLLANISLNDIFTQSSKCLASDELPEELEGRVKIGPRNRGNLGHEPTKEPFPINPHCVCNRPETFHRRARVILIRSHPCGTVHDDEGPYALWMLCGERNGNDRILASTQKNRWTTYLIHDFAKPKDLTVQVSFSGTSGESSAIGYHQCMILSQPSQPMGVKAVDGRSCLTPAGAGNQGLISTAEYLVSQS